jgi:hypothetical protein
VAWHRCLPRKPPEPFVVNHSAGTEISRTMTRHGNSLVSRVLSRLETRADFIQPPEYRCRQETELFSWPDCRCVATNRTRVQSSASFGSRSLRRLDPPPSVPFHDRRSVLFSPFTLSSAAHPMLGVWTAPYSIGAPSSSTEVGPWDYVHCRGSIHQTGVAGKGMAHHARDRAQSHTGLSPSALSGAFTGFSPLDLLRDRPGWLGSCPSLG